jgi:hypothetical protein
VTVDVTVDVGAAQVETEEVCALHPLACNVMGKHFACPKLGATYTLYSVSVAGQAKKAEEPLYSRFPELSIEKLLSGGVFALHWTCVIGAAKSAA